MNSNLQEVRKTYIILYMNKRDKISTISTPTRSHTLNSEGC